VQDAPGVSLGVLVGVGVSNWVVMCVVEAAGAWALSDMA
jgi:hypothetical protein